MKLLFLVVRRYKINAGRIFKLACEYNEIVATPNQYWDWFLSFCKKDSDGKWKLIDCPEIVSDWCIDLLAKRTIIPKKYKKGEKDWEVFL